MRKLLLLFAMAVVLAGACTGNSTPPANTAASPAASSFTVAPTSVPTNVPTAKLAATAISQPTENPTEEPTPVATPTPEPVSTTAPTYVGLPADEVTKLREQCLQKNPDSLCLPLPFPPAADAVVEIIFEDISDSGLRVADGINGDRYLAIAVPAGTDLLAPLGGDVWIRGKIPGNGSPRWLNRPGRSIEGISAVSFTWGPFLTPDDGSVDLVIVKSGCGNILRGGRDGRIIFREGDLTIPVRSQVVVGELLTRVDTAGCLAIRNLELLYYSIPFPDGSGTGSGSFAFSRIELSDLLRTEAGSIVYILP